MRSLLISGSQAGRQRLHKLWVNTPASPQVVFATPRLRTTPDLVRSLYELVAQASAHVFYTHNTSRFVFMHTIHNPNKSYDKGV